MVTTEIFLNAFSLHIFLRWVSFHVKWPVAHYVYLLLMVLVIALPLSCSIPYFFPHFTHVLAFIHVRPLFLQLLCIILREYGQ